MIEVWKLFLESLATRGGRIAILSFFGVLLIGVGVLFAYSPPPQPDAEKVLLGLITLVVGALLTSLRGNPPPKPSG
ncbi:hypothetical protein LCGC14_0935690 [marine sediment metagenome]|uniref:Uncharacterized protein n=1 Tax=marine sediment metagenome TaxID=412755 RepID=A0A0F9P7S7_9ZZZZ